MCSKRKRSINRPGSVLASGSDQDQITPINSRIVGLHPIDTGAAGKELCVVWAFHDAHCCPGAGVWRTWKKWERALEQR